MPPGGAPNTPPNGPPPSAIQTRPPLVSFLTSDVPPSQYLFTRDDDQLTCLIATNATGQQITFRYRYLTPQNEIKEGTKITPPLTAGVITVFNIPLTEGWLLSLSAQGGAIGANAWQFAQIHLERQPGLVTFITYGLIWQGYIPINGATGWPGTPAREITDGAGTLRSITGTVPGAGAEIAETVPTSRRWNLLAIRYTLTTSVTVANRSSVLAITDGANIIVGSPNQAVQAASTGLTYNRAPGYNVAAGFTNDQYAFLPSPCSMKAGFKIQTFTGAIQAGDQYSAPQYLVQEFGQWDS